MLNLLLYAATAAVSAAATYGLLRAQSRIPIIDVPNERSSHSRPKPRTGGIALYAAFVAGWLLWRPQDAAGRWLLLGGTAFFVLGLVDDMLHLSEWSRLAIEFGVSAAIAALGPRVDVVGLPFLGVWRLPAVVAVAVTSLWCTGFTNVFNFMDGADGLAAGQAALVGLFMAVLTPSPWPLIVSAAAAGFLIFNREPSRIFMGDSGSHLLGFTIAYLAVVGAHHGAPIVVYVLLVGTFLIDTSTTLARRIRRRENWLRAHRSHYYQRLMSLGWSHSGVTGLNAALTLGLGAAALAYPRLGAAAQAALLAACCGVLAAGLLLIERREMIK